MGTLDAQFAPSEEKTLIHWQDNTEQTSGGFFRFGGLVDGQFNVGCLDFQHDRTVLKIYHHLYEKREGHVGGASLTFFM